jgi:hypothetical protein
MLKAVDGGGGAGRGWLWRWRMKAVRELRCLSVAGVKLTQTELRIFKVG